MFLFTLTNLQKALMSGVARLLLLVAVLRAELQTAAAPSVLNSSLTATAAPLVLNSSLTATAAPLVLNSSLTTSPFNSSMEKPEVQRLHRPCGSGHNKTYCANGGQCMYPQDSSKPSCICKQPYSGPRCMVHSAFAHTQPGLEKVIGITFGVIMVICILTGVILCCIHKKCVKETPLKTSTMTQTLV